MERSEGQSPDGAPRRLARILQTYVSCETLEQTQRTPRSVSPGGSFTFFDGRSLWTGSPRSRTRSRTCPPSYFYISAAPPPLRRPAQRPAPERCPSFRSKMESQPALLWRPAFWPAYFSCQGTNPSKMEAVPSLSSASMVSRSRTVQPTSWTPYSAFISRRLALFLSLQL